MNISRVSFGADTPKIERINRDNFEFEDSFDVPSPAKGKEIDTSKTQVFTRTPKKDEFKKSKLSDKTQKYNAVTNKEKSAKKPPIYSIRRPFNAFLAGIAATFAIQTGVQIANKPDSYVVLPVDSNTKITEVASTYDTDATAIYAYNQINKGSDLDAVEQITVPTMYSNVEDEIEVLQNKLFNQKLTAEERAHIENRIRYLSNHQYLQNALATVYTDGKYVYYTINELGKDTPEFIRNKFGKGIPVRDFKDIFGIKDTAVKSVSTIFNGTSGMDGGYMGFSTNQLTAGNTVRVPVSAVKTGDELAGVNLFEMFS